MSSEGDRVQFFLEGVRHRYRAIVSPEGVPLAVELAEHGERAAAFLLDLFFWLCATIVLYLFGIALWVEGIGGEVGISIVLFIAFAIRNLYFVYFELAWHGATPGKRLLGLRVVDRRGGPLLPEAVITRNLTREIEAFLPLGLLITLQAQGTAFPAWEKLCLGIWLLCFSTMPFFNRDRMRGGDLIAGTMVIALPRRVLSGDLVASDAHYAFTDRQLGNYGTFELQILEELLRRPEGLDTVRLRRDVCDKIRRKIDWPTAVPDADTATFLREFYTAERAYLEREQLFGKRHPDKDHRAPGDREPQRAQSNTAAMRSTSIPSSTTRRS